MSPESHSAAEIPERLRLVEQEIAFACEASGRSLHAVKLIAVSKTMPAAAIECHSSALPTELQPLTLHLYDRSMELRGLEPWPHQCD